MVFTRRTLPLVIVASALGLGAPSVPADTGGGGKNAAAREEEAAAQRGDAKVKPPTKPAEKSKEERPACMHCGATCGLVAVCVCKPGTRITPRTEYEAKPDPICVPCCGGPPWPWGGHRRAAGCTGCEVECHDAWVRQRKKLVKETKDEEQPRLERKVAWVCRGCGPGDPVTCTGGGDVAPRRASWWPAWLPHP